MRGRSLVALTAALLGSSALVPENAYAGTPVACTALAGMMQSANTYVVAATSQLVAATGSNAAYCNVQLTFDAKSGPTFGYATGESQSIKIGVGLPLNSVDGGSGGVQGAWNGKVQNIGGGGNAGAVGSTVSATNAGWVGSSTDGGHTTADNGTLGNWGVIQATHQLDLGKINDFAYESLHQQYLWALWLSNKYFGQAASRNYWYGCSTGGRQGLALAEKWGGDFDGIVAGAPALYMGEFLLATGWAAYVNRDDVVGAGHPAITSAQFNLANSHAIAACDVQGTDAVADGVIDDPRQCNYSAAADTSVLAAPAGTCVGANCVDPVQAAAIDKIWDGPRNHYGRRLWQYYQKGTPTGPGLNIGPAPGGQLGPGQAAAWIERDLTFSASNVYSSRALAAANPLGQPQPIAMEDLMHLATVDGGLDNYVGNTDYRGILTSHANGPKQMKLILWHGGADPNIFPADSINFYRLAATAYGNGTTDFAGLSSWFRFYHAPGVAHCGSGVGASPLTILADKNPQILDDLVNWVENGVPPQSAGDATHAGILATGPGAFGTRPICPWPTTAIWNGSGPTNLASSYTCGGNLDASAATVCADLHTVYRQETSSTSNWKDMGAAPPPACPLGQ